MAQVGWDGVVGDAWSFSREKSALAAAAVVVVVNVDDDMMMILALCSFITKRGGCGQKK